MNALVVHRPLNAYLAQAPALILPPLWRKRCFPFGLNSRKLQSDMKQIPKRLKKEPLIEAIWELRFDSPGSGEILPGVLYSALKQCHPEIQRHRLPMADLPAIVAQIDPNLRFMAKIRLEVPGSPLLWQVGERVVTLNCRKPYVGWQPFKENILALTRVVEDSGLVPNPERHSLRYIDLLTLDPPPVIAALKLEMKLGGHAIERYPLQMRLELPDEGCLHVLQIATPANAQLPDGILTATVVDLESFVADRPADWNTLRGQMEMLHERSKRLFFEHILTDQAIEDLEPEY